MKTRLPIFSKKKPVKGGERIVGARTEYAVVSSKKIPCGECGGLGYQWLVRFRSKYGIVSEVTLAVLHRNRYQREDEPNEAG